MSSIEGLRNLIHVIGPSFAQTFQLGVRCLHDLIHHVDVGPCCFLFFGMLAGVRHTYVLPGIFRLNRP